MKRATALHRAQKAHRDHGAQAQAAASSGAASTSTKTTGLVKHWGGTHTPLSGVVVWVVCKYCYSSRT